MLEHESHRVRTEIIKLHAGTQSEYHLSWDDLEKTELKQRAQVSCLLKGLCHDIFELTETAGYIM